MEGLDGQGFDGATAMSGRLNGVQSIISEKYPSILYMHCVSHFLNVTLTSSSAVTNVRNTQGTICELINFINHLFKSLFTRNYE